MLAPLLCAVLLADAPSLELAPSTVRPGDVLLLRVTGAPAPPSGTLAGRTLAFWRAGEGEWRALAPLPVETAPGAMAVRVQSAEAALTAELTVVEPGFGHHAITLDRKYVEPPRSVKRRIAADHKAFARAFAQTLLPAPLPG